MASGGTSASFGFSYQFLATAVYALQFLRNDLSLISRTIIDIEPSAVDVAGEPDDIVDFAIVVDDEVHTQVQVKASVKPSVRPIAPAEAASIFRRLDGLPGSGAGLLLSNRQLSPSLREQCSDGTSIPTGTEVRWMPTGGIQKPVGGTPEARRIVLTQDVAALEGMLEELIRAFRRDRSLTQGETSSHLLGMMLRQRIFDAAAGQRTSRISGLELTRILFMPDARIAHAIGGFDWGNPLPSIPNVKSSVPRLDLLDRVAQHLRPESRTPSIAVLTGHTGVGKSIAASDYCHYNYNRYEIIFWFDCRDPELLEAQVREQLSTLQSTPIQPGRNVGPLFTAALASHRGPWLIVFDGVVERRDIDSYLPSFGHGAAVITTTNSIGWWPTAHVQELSPFTLGEAMACFASYASIAESDVASVAGPISEIVERLGRIPLAISMAGLYFRNAEGQLNELILKYFETLDSIADELAIPAGYDRTLFASITTAVQELGQRYDTDLARSARGMLYYAALLAPELVPLNLIVPATAATVDLDLGQMPKPTAADPHTLRAIIAIMRTETIAHRVVGESGSVGGELATDTVVLHPLVHEVLRAHYLSVLPAGQLQSVVSTLLYFLIPWLGTMRTGGAFLALEQLRVHAEELLTVMNDNGPLAAFSAKHQRIYLFLKGGLLMELAACFATTARIDRAVSLSMQAISLFLEQMPDDEIAQTFATKAASDVVTDLATAGAPPYQLASVAERLVPMIAQLERSERTSDRSLAYSHAHQARLMVTHVEEYRQFLPLRHLADALTTIADRDPAKYSDPAWLIRRVNQRMHTGEYAEVLAGIPHLRAANNSIHDRFTIDALEIASRIYTGDLPTAFSQLDILLGTEIVANHLVLELRAGLAKVANALDFAGRETVDFHGPLAEYLSRVFLRIEALDRSIQNVQPGPAHDNRN